MAFRVMHCVVIAAHTEGEVTTSFAEGLAFQLHCPLWKDVQLLSRKRLGDADRGLLG